MHAEVPQGPIPPNESACLIANASDEPYCDFATAVEDFGAAGVPVFPVSFDEKKPLVSNAALLGVRGAHEHAKKRPNANVGFWCGKRSGLTVVDVDSTALEQLHWARENFGPTPIEVMTASGKYHLYYRHNGERRTKVRDRPIDLLGKGLCLAPPSILGGKRYQFIAGDHTDLSSLPTIRPQALSFVKNPANHGPALAALEEDANPVREGERNNTLFNFGLTIAEKAEDPDAFLEAILAENARYDPPLPDEEASRVAASVWGYKVNHKLFQRGQQRVQLLFSAVAPLFRQGEADALFLHAFLQSKHFQYGKVFAVSPRGMTASRLFGTWSYRRIARARETLIRFGLLEQLHKGGKGKNDPSLYRFAKGAIH